ncbi:MAG: aminotransferase class I/II-fold pyridoxal phosphate-dependent enzyme [Actinomycetota bacterium]|nr:aminotransferase class I/II-fold pyridoxal phosphate-dependent enzyme [Actinomycetota bacterium]MDK1016998.1 aminotransferase class I/II-fold pyridoxal phosphate-dependent enzyme [Actinomycetota bacterium]MDK1026742.1 aminotransferase class I/II-fold pyridoxal phosphate-dependent enzyme [Actinomycetota bacterium]MDK1037683.1 aminotransferase class I/II-fold pyridoxal phosphate-dependent enzyme [Actinomycetota bacterium]MDK1096034.1 aminotransferase class I/II-fold pyridoxal phosphate-depende
MRIADRIANLGTETAFAVSGEAAIFASEGNRVFPFHLGDINLPTPSTVVEGAAKAIADGKTGYCPNAGIPQLREALAADVAASHNTEYTAENVVMQPGGKPTIGKFILTLMNPGDEVLYPNPGYPIYESQIEFNGGIAVPYGYVEGAENFELDFDSIERGITDKTRLLILNDLQNPMGAECSIAEHEQLAEIVREHDLYVLADEAYFDMRYSGKSVSFVEQPGMAERTVVLYTFSKKFAMTGWRLGASIGPKEIVDVIAKINVNHESCSNHFIQYGALAGLLGDQSEPQAILDTLEARRDATAAGLNVIDGIRTFTPNATFYLFPNVTELMERKGMDDYEEFRRAALHATGVSFTSRIHFGRPLEDESDRYIRFAYSGIDVPAIEEGLALFKEWAEQ